MTTVQVPASRLEIPKHFGRRPDAAFLPAGSLEERALTEASRVQHHAAVAVLDELARRDLSIVWLADELGENDDHLRRKLYGQVSANLRDLCTWGAMLGVETVRPVTQLAAEQYSQTEYVKHVTPMQEAAADGR
jgi:hypothetical protein